MFAAAPALNAPAALSPPKPLEKPLFPVILELPNELSLLPKGLEPLALNAGKAVDTPNPLPKGEAKAPLVGVEGAPNTLDPEVELPVFPNGFELRLPLDVVPNIEEPLAAGSPNIVPKEAPPGGPKAGVPNELPLEPELAGVGLPKRELVPLVPNELPLLEVLLPAFPNGFAEEFEPKGSLGAEDVPKDEVEVPKRLLLFSVKDIPVLAPNGFAGVVDATVPKVEVDVPKEEFPKELVVDVAEPKVEDVLPKRPVDGLLLPNMLVGAEIVSPKRLAPPTAAAVVDAKPKVELAPKAEEVVVEEAPKAKAGADPKLPKGADTDVLSVELPKVEAVVLVDPNPNAAELGVVKDVVCAAKENGVVKAKF